MLATLAPSSGEDTLNKRPTDDEDKPKPVNIQDLRKQAEAEGLTAEEAARRAKEVVDNINNVAARQVKDAVGQSLNSAGESVKAAMAESLGGFNTIADKIPKVPQAGSLFIQDYEEFQQQEAQRQKAMTEAVDGIYERQRQERERQDRLEAERIDREKENLAIAKESRNISRHSRQLAAWALVVAILALIAGVVIPLIAG